jgi:hypothetical protein
MKRSVFLSTFLVAAVLSPITLQGYNCAPPPTAKLSILELRVGSFSGENVIEGFNPNVFSYDVRFPESESVGVLWVKTNHPSTKVDVEYDGLPVQLVGQSVAELDVPLGQSELSLVVTRLGATPDTNTYVVRILRAPIFACTEQGIRDAIAYGGGPNYFDCEGPTVVPTVAEIVIDNDVILDGEGNMIVDAGGGTGGTGGAGGDGAGGAGFMAAEVAPKANGPHRVFDIPEGVTAELIGFSVTGGVTDEAGGGIRNAGTLMLANSVVSGNTARFGAGIRNGGEGRADVIDTMVSNNFATQAAGGISNRLEGATMTLSGSTVQQNTAAGDVGGISNSGTLTMIDTTVTANEAGGEAGGIRNTGTAELNETTISGNQAGNDGGGVFNRGELTLMNSTVSGNIAGWDGGGIHNFVGTLTLIDCTVSSNSAVYDGGGILNEGTFTVRNSTVTANKAHRGGGISSFGALSLINSSVSVNTADSNDGGILIAGVADLQGSSITQNSAQFVSGGVGVAGQMTMSDCLVSGNSAASGAGIGNGGTAEVLDSVVSGNTATEDGGGIVNGGTLTLTNTTLRENSADRGGGVHNAETATLIVTDCNVSQNTAMRFAGGVGNLGQMDVTDSVVSGNEADLGGGGVSNFPEVAMMTLTRTTVTGNATAGSGGGIRNTGTAELNETTVSGNHASDGGGGVLNRGDLTLMNSTVSGNTNTGVFNSFEGVLTVISSTVSGNTDDGIRQSGSLLRMTNSTVSQNTGVGIHEDGSGSATLENSTVSNECAIAVAPPGSVRLKNTLIAGACTSVVSGEPPPATCDQAGINVASLGHNLESPGDTCRFDQSTDTVNVSADDLKLGELANNGGPTETHALQSSTNGEGSVAIDVVPEADCLDTDGQPLVTDQRGLPRPVAILGPEPKCDVGAFEVQSGGTGGTGGTGGAGGTGGTGGDGGSGGG